MRFSKKLTLDEAINISFMEPCPCQGKIECNTCKNENYCNASNTILVFLKDKALNFIKEISTIDFNDLTDVNFTYNKLDELIQKARKIIEE